MNRATDPLAADLHASVLEVHRCQRDLAGARQERNELIGCAEEDGWTLPEIAVQAGLSVTQVHTIVIAQLAMRQQDGISNDADASRDVSNAIP